MAMDIHQVLAIFMRRFRPGRMKRIRELFPELDVNCNVLDVGGTWGWWKMMGVGTPDITIVNIDRVHEQEVLDAGYKFSSANGCDLPYKDGQFELAFSNSVIEHVGGLKEQGLFAREMLRCGRKLYLQTPNKWFPIEPHLVAPFIHWLPEGIQSYLVRWLSVWGWVNRPTVAESREFIRSIRLMTLGELQAMFPGCSIEAERFFGLPKSYIVTRR
ncbi:MAG: hypothetical protein RI907_587 [Pseudomonadota bacterium]|jgi:hypothetical protein